MWMFPSNEKAIKEQKDVQKLEDVIDELDMGLRGQRKRLLAPSSQEGKDYIAQ